MVNQLEGIKGLQEMACALNICGGAEPGLHRGRSRNSAKGGDLYKIKGRQTSPLHFFLFISFVIKKKKIKGGCVPG